MGIAGNNQVGQCWALPVAYSAACWYGAPRRGRSPGKYRLRQGCPRRGGHARTPVAEIALPRFSSRSPPSREHPRQRARGHVSDTVRRREEQRVWAPVPTYSSRCCSRPDQVRRNGYVPQSRVALGVVHVDLTPGPTCTPAHVDDLDDRGSDQCLHVRWVEAGQAHQAASGSSPCTCRASPPPARPARPRS